MKPMKLIGRSAAGSIALSLLSAGVLVGAEVASEPYAILLVTVDGGGTVGTPKVSMIAASLYQPVEWQGAIEAISGTRITVSYGA